MLEVGREDPVFGCCTELTHLTHSTHAERLALGDVGKQYQVNVSGYVIQVWIISSQCVGKNVGDTVGESWALIIFFSKIHKTLL